MQLLLAWVIASIRASERSSSFASLGVGLVAKQLLQIVSLREASCLCLTMGLLGVTNTAEAAPLGVSS
ncbi:MAG: hypothetical protein VXZ35_10895 [Pseudomonadota bacterium]|nr:hypothetical protein [Pseudomonadota bacterium]